MGCTKAYGAKLRHLAVAAMLLIVAVMVSPNEAVSQRSSGQQQYRDGVHFATINIPVRPTVAGTIEVVELFSYACIHCLNFDPHLEAWLVELPDDVAFQRTPVNFGNRIWRLYAQAYYTAEASEVLTKESHTAFFNAIHKHRTARVRDLPSVAKFFTRFGGTEQAFIDTYNSFAVHNKVAQSRGKVIVYGVNGVPTLVVAGRYRIESNNLKRLEDMLDVADFLIKRERADRLQAEIVGEAGG